MLRGVDILANAVKVTLGPRAARRASTRARRPRITKDGVTVAKEIELEDKFENMAPRWYARSRRRPTISPVTAPHRDRARQRS